MQSPQFLPIGQIAACEGELQFVVCGQQRPARQPQSTTSCGRRPGCVEPRTSSYTKASRGCLIPTALRSSEIDEHHRYGQLPLQVTGPAQGSEVPRTSRHLHLQHGGCERESRQGACGAQGGIRTRLGTVARSHGIDRSPSMVMFRSLPVCPDTTGSPMNLGCLSLGCDQFPCYWQLQVAPTQLVGGRRPRRRSWPLFAADNRCTLAGAVLVSP
jgi:hypothetical protein